MLKKSILLFLVFALFSTQTTFSQSTGKSVVLLQGRVLDVQSNEGISTGIQFVDKNGRKIQTRSAGGTGQFQQVLNPNENYIVMFKDYLLVNESKRYSTPNVNEYHETTKDFQVKKIVTGMDLFHFIAFNPNESSLSSETVLYMNELKEMLSYNPKVNVIITITTGDSHFKPYKKKVPDLSSKKKNKTKSVTVTAEEQLRELADARIATVKDYMRKNTIPEKLATFETIIKSGPAAPAKIKTGKKKDKSATSLPIPTKSDNLLVRVGRILNL